MGALNLPAVPINLALEAAMLPTAEKSSSTLAEITGLLVLKRAIYEPGFV